MLQILGKLSQLLQFAYAQNPGGYGATTGSNGLSGHYCPTFCSGPYTDNQPSINSYAFCQKDDNDGGSDYNYGGRDNDRDCSGTRDYGQNECDRGDRGGDGGDKGGDGGDGGPCGGGDNDGGNGGDSGGSDGGSCGGGKD